MKETATFFSVTSRRYVIVGRDVEVYHHTFSHINVCSLKKIIAVDVVK